jgi:hypothetical protein
MKIIYIALALALLIGSAIGAEPRINTAQVNWTQSLPSGEGVIFSGTAPGTTTNALYSDGGTLKFDGEEIGSGSAIAAYDAIITQGTDGAIYGYHENGTLIASDTSAPYNIGPVFNAVVTDLKGTNTNANGLSGKSIVFNVASGFTNSTMWLYPFMTVTSIGKSKIRTWDHIPIFVANQTDYSNQYIWVENLLLATYNSTEPFDHGIIEVYNPRLCRFHMLECYHYELDYSYNNRQSLYLYANQTMSIYMKDVSDSYIAMNSLTGLQRTRHAVYLTGNSSSNHIKNNHIMCYPYAGIYSTGTYALGEMDISGNMFESGGTDLGNESTGILLEGSNPWTNSHIVGNTFWGLERFGMFFYGGLKYSSITGNTFKNCNIQNGGYSDIRLDARASGGCVLNSVIGNTFENTVATTTGRAYPVLEFDATYDPTTNIYVANTGGGTGYVGGISSLSGSVEANNMGI